MHLASRYVPSSHTQSTEGKLFISPDMAEPQHQLTGTIQAVQIRYCYPSKYLPRGRRHSLDEPFLRSSTHSQLTVSLRYQLLQPHQYQLGHSRRTVSGLLQSHVYADHRQVKRRRAHFCNWSPTVIHIYTEQKTARYVTS